MNFKDSKMTEQEMVQEFHVRNGFKFCGPIGNNQRNTDGQISWDNATIDLEYLVEKLEIQCSCIKTQALLSQQVGDERLWRAWLMLEELTEVIEAMAENNEEKLADGLGDLAYVVKGTAVTFGIPMVEVFEEIHKANMLKKKRDPLTNPRMRDKGCGWKRPDIAGAIKKGRERCL